MISIVESVEISSIHLDHIVHTVAYSKTQARRVGGKREVIHVGISVRINRTLNTSTYFPRLIQIIFCTEEIFFRACIEQFVAVCTFQARLSLLVEIVVITQVQTKTFHRTHLHTKCEQRWDVAAHFCAIAIGCERRKIVRAFTICRFVLESDGCAEFVFSCYINIFAAEMRTHDRSKTKIMLVCIESHIFCCFRKHSHLTNLRSQS